MEKNGNGLAELERRLWAAADQLWANSSLRLVDYSGLVSKTLLPPVEALGILTPPE